MRLLKWRRLSAGHYVAKGRGTTLYHVDRYDPEDGERYFWTVSEEDDANPLAYEEIGADDELARAKDIATWRYLRDAKAAQS